MRRDSRLSGVLHVLIHMAQTEQSVTSETMARAMSTNPVVARRVMGRLRDAGFVRSEKGRGGGWRMARDLTDMTLRDVYAALGSPELFAMGNRNDAPVCLVEQAVNSALGEAFQAAEALLMERFGDVTVATIASDFQHRLAAAGAPAAT